MTVTTATTDTPKPAYVGRFAPSPTGSLHFGSLVAAVGSYLDARAHRGRWLLRIEDVDTPRTVAGAADAIFTCLERFGLEWDGAPLWQSQRLERYAEVLETLKQRGLAFPCACSRKEIADSALARDGSRVYPGNCRAGLPAGRSARAWRLRVAGSIDFTDQVQGAQHEDLETEVGDFVLLRADGCFAYQLAVVVDDADSGITHIVRGADLLDSTARQLYLQRVLGLPQPVYAHLPVATNAAGEKLSKQTLAAPIDEWPVTQTLQYALQFLGHAMPESLRHASLTELWQWAIANWSLAAVPAQRQCVAPAFATLNARQAPYQI